MVFAEALPDESRTASRCLWPVVFYAAFAEAGQGLKMQTVFYSFSIFEGGGGGEVDRDNENDAIECSKLQVEQRTIAILSIKDSERGFSW